MGKTFGRLKTLLMVHVLFRIEFKIHTERFIYRVIDYLLCRNVYADTEVICEYVLTTWFIKENKHHYKSGITEVSIVCLSTPFTLNELLISPRLSGGETITKISDCI